MEIRYDGTDMNKRKSLSAIIFLFLTSVVFASTYLLKQTQFLGKFAQQGSAAISFSAAPSGPLRRIWSNFSQGGEQTKLMLTPAADQISLLQPNYIRIDHIFDFPDLDQRVEEIIRAGARPFLSLSYFPSSISEELTKLPPSLEKWGALVEQTVQRYSGKNQKNLLDLYYEVWNEPDLFGKMTPEQYFALYQTTVVAAQKCQNCNPFRIGGPAITTLKKDWMDKFLRLAGRSSLRLDFVSWHSYQINPEKTAWEAKTLKELPGFTQFYPQAELIVSEWGSVPEVSNLHDSYFGASHTIWAIEKLKNSVDKLFTFELVDGPSPEGKKYWGRWGLLTHESQGLTAKPRYYPYLYLSKLLEFEMRLQEASPNIAVIGSTDGKESYSLILTRPKGNFGPIPAQIILAGTLPGIYNLNSYFLDLGNNPLIPQASVLQSNGTISITLSLNPNAVVLAELTRISPALITAPGRTEETNDSSAKITSLVPPLVFPWNTKDFQKGKIGFWFKANWDEEKSQNQTLLESVNEEGSGLSAWLEKDNLKKIHWGFLSQGQLVQQTVLPVQNWEPNTWHYLVFLFDLRLKTLGVQFDNEQATVSLGETYPLGNRLYIGADQKRANPAEGFIDDLTIKLNDGLIYEEGFN